ncbi:MAG TPA: VWA domain-containing protein [Bryobacteraceae bacterium]|nr:VWA domain-containing protein [Bryobacteraceae bacterium]
MSPKTVLLPATLATMLIAAPPKPGTLQPINLNLIAIDSHGQSVPGLTAEDLQVFDNGKRRRIVWLRPLAQTNPTSIFIVFDLLNSDFAARARSATEITEALERLGIDDHVYLYLLSNAQRIRNPDGRADASARANFFAVHGVTARSEKPSDGIPWTRRVKPILDDALRQVNSLKSQEERLPELRIQPTWSALGALIPQLAAIPGPKSFIWITQGVENGFSDHRDTTPIRIFAANLNALETLGFSVEQRPDGSVPVNGEGSRTDTLTQISELTGGRVLPSDYTDEAISRAFAAANQMNYRIAFESDHLDGKYHKLRVFSTRKDIRIQTAGHYYALPDADAQSRAEAAENAIGRSPFDFDEIGITVAVIPVEEAPGQFRFSVRVNAQDVELIREGTRYKGSVDVEVIGACGQLAPVATQDIDLSEEDYARSLKDGIVLTHHEKLDPAATRVRVIVFDRHSYLAGTATAPVRA